LAVAWQILLQVATGNIGQLTYTRPHPSVTMSEYTGT
jgi:hypothetical protein